MAATQLPPAEFLRECFSYDPETGAFTWNCRPVHHFPDAETAFHWNARYAGQPALTTDCKGHLKGQVMHAGRRYRIFAHRVAWKMVTGEDPKDQIDHISGDKRDNRFANLREASALQNAWNKPARKAHLPKGVFRCGKKYRAKIFITGRGNVFLGRFDTQEEAAAAYTAVASARHGEFLNLNRPTPA